MRYSAQSASKLGFAFEDFCATLLQALGYDVEREPSDSEGRDVDLIAFGPDETLYIQVKFSNRPLNSLSRLRDLAARTTASMFPPGQHTAVLLVSSTLNPAAKAWASEEFGLTIWDRSDLTRLSVQVGLDNDDLATRGSKCATPFQVSIWGPPDHFRA